MFKGMMLETGVLCVVHSTLIAVANILTLRISLRLSEMLNTTAATNVFV